MEDSWNAFNLLWNKYKSDTKLVDVMTDLTDAETFENLIKSNYGDTKLVLGLLDWSKLSRNYQAVCVIIRK